MDRFCEHYANEAQKLEYSVILEKRDRILKKVNRYLLSGSRFTEITPQNFKQVVTADKLKYIADQIDLEFFDNKLIETFNKNGCCISFCMGKACGSTAGFCSYRKGVKPEDRVELTVKMMPNVFIKSFKNVDIKLRAVDNIPCNDILTCFFITFCHELIHGVVFCNCKDYDKTDKGPGNWAGLTRPGNGHSKTFMSILNNRYGHKTFVHNLKRGVTVQKLEREVFGHHNIKVGDIVVLQVKQLDGSFREEEARIISAGKVQLKAVPIADPSKYYKGRYYSSILRKVSYSPKITSAIRKRTTPPPVKVEPLDPSPLSPRPKTPSPRRKTPTSSNNKPLVLPKNPKPKTKKKIIRKKKSQWSNANPNTFLKAYASKKRFSTLEEAKHDGLLESNVGGITKSGKKEVYSLRKGKTLGHSPSGEVSWLKL